MSSAGAGVISCWFSNIFNFKGSILNTKNAQSNEIEAVQHAPLTPPISEDELENGTNARNIQSGPNIDSIEDNPQPSAFPSSQHFERPLGATELSYFLPSRGDGVNDMYLHLGFRAPARLLSHARLRAVWAYQRLVHTPLAAKLRQDPGTYDSVRFVYVPPPTAHHALLEADASLEIRAHSRWEGKDSLISEYLNGPRTLSNDCLARLVLASASVPENDDIGIPTPLSTPRLGPNPIFALDQKEKSSNIPDVHKEYDLLICATHFLGDGMALHRFANEVFILLAGRDESGQVKTTEELEALAKHEWETRWGRMNPETSNSKDDQTSGGIGLKVLPLALEDALPKVEGRFRRAAGRIDFQCSQRKAIGGHSFPRAKHSTKHTVVPTISFDEKKTKAILKRCKENGVSIANAIFALNALAWSRAKGLNSRDSLRTELPIMMYTALNLRPYLLPHVVANASYWFTAVGYLNIILPSFLPSSHGIGGETSAHAVPESTALHRIFWHRARDVKRQIRQGSKHPLLMMRTHEMARMRAERSCIWAREDDERAAGTWSPQPSKKTPEAAAAPVPSSVTVETATEPWVLPAAPSTVLMGLSLLGNLDATYIHASFPDLTLHTLTTGSRQRQGAALLFAYTFCGRLWLSLGYDVNGFADGMMEKWWDAVLLGVDEFLVN